MEIANWTKRLVFPVLLLLAVMSSANAAWWDEDWTHRQPITISNTAGELNDYQIKVELNSNNTDPNFNWSNNGDDLRFVDNSSSEISYWIEEWDAIQQKAVIWVKVPYLKNDNETIIHMYYGNPTAISKSNGKNTFEFFDFFADNDISSWNVIKWGRYDGNATADNEQMKLKVYKCYNVEVSKNLGEYNTDLAFKFHWRTKADQWYEATDWDVLINNTKIPREVILGEDVKKPGPGGTKEGIVEAVVNASGKVELLYRIYQSGYCNYGDHANTYFWIDNLRVRKYVSPEPSVEVGDGNMTSKLPELNISPADLTLYGQPVLNKNLNISAEVKNVGEVDADNITVKFFEAAQNNVSYIGEQIIDSLSSDDTVSVKINWTVQVAGSHKINVSVDPYDHIEERDESNNEASVSVEVSACPWNAQQKLFQALNHEFAGHGYDFYEKYRDYEDNAAHQDLPKTCYTELEDDDVWINYLSSDSRGLYPCSAYLFGPKIGLDTNSWYDDETQVRGIYYPELELEITDDWLHNKPLISENENLKKLLQKSLLANKWGFESDGIYSQGNISFDEGTNRSTLTTKFSGRFATPGSIFKGGDCQLESNKYYDADTDRFGDNLNNISCCVDLNVPVREAGLGKNVNYSLGLVKFDGKVNAGATLSPDASGGLRLGLKPHCIEPAGNIEAEIGLDAEMMGELCLASKCYDIESSLPEPKISVPEFTGEAVIPYEDFASGDHLRSLYPNPDGSYVIYEDLNNLNPVFRVATSEVDINYEMNINLKEIGVPCGQSFPSPPCNIKLYNGSMFHIDPWQQYWGFTEVTVHSPVDLHLYDKSGRHVGLDSSGKVELQIPNSTYIEKDNKKTIRFPTVVDKFTLLLKGTDGGNYTLNISRPIMVETENGNSTIKGVTYRMENTSTFRNKSDYYNIDFTKIEQNVNEMVEQGLHTDRAVEKGFNLIVEVQNASKSPSSLYSNDVTAYNGQNTTLHTKLYSLDKPLSNKTVFFTLDGKKIGHNTTNNNGEAMLEYNVPHNAEVGVHKIKCVYNGSVSYYNSTGTAYLHILNRKPQISMNVTNFPSGSVFIDGSIFDSNVDSLSLKIDGKTVSDSVPYQWNTSEYCNGYHCIELVANDSYGEKGRATTYVFVHNPIADAGGPYKGLEGHEILLDGSKSYDPYDGIKSWLWDLDEDDILETNATKNKGIVKYTWGDDHSGRISLQVKDRSGGTGTNSTRVVVYNVAPIANAGDNQEVTAGDAVYFNGSFSDPGWLDEHNFSWNFGNGYKSTDLETVHTFYQKGSYDVSLKVRDDDGGTGENTTEIIVNPIPANVSIKPEKLNLKSKGKFTALVTLPKNYNTTDIDPDSIICNNTTAKWVKNTESNLIIAKFEREGLNVSGDGDVTNLTVEGKIFHNGGYADFEGSDTVNLKKEKARERNRMI